MESIRKKKKLLIVTHRQKQTRTIQKYMRARSHSFIFVVIYNFTYYAPLKIFFVNVNKFYVYIYIKNTPFNNAHLIKVFFLQNPSPSPFEKKKLLITSFKLVFIFLSNPSPHQPIIYSWIICYYIYILHITRYHRAIIPRQT